MQKKSGADKTQPVWPSKDSFTFGDGFDPIRGSGVLRCRHGVNMAPRLACCPAGGRTVAGMHLGPKNRRVRGNAAPIRSVRQRSGKSGPHPPASRFRVDFNQLEVVVLEAAGKIKCLAVVILFDKIKRGFAFSGVAGNGARIIGVPEHPCKPTT